jgi:hypothetical protein
MIRRWTTLLDEHGALPFENCVEMATTLTEAQIDGMSSLFQELGATTMSSLFETPSARHVLRLYNLLSPAQRQALWQGESLSIVRMAPAQRQRFMAMLWARHRVLWNPMLSETRPLDLGQLASGTLTLTTEPYAGILERRGGVTTLRLERAAVPADPAGGVRTPRAGPPPLRGGGAGSPAAAGNVVPGQHVARTERSAGDTIPTEVRRVPVTRLKFTLEYGPELRDRIDLTVAAPKAEER